MPLSFFFKDALIQSQKNILKIENNKYFQKYNYHTRNKEVAGSEECSPKAYCLYKAELVIKHYLYTMHDKENHLL